MPLISGIRETVTLNSSGFECDIFDLSRFVVLVKLLFLVGVGCNTGDCGSRVNNVGVCVGRGNVECRRKV